LQIPGTEREKYNELHAKERAAGRYRRFFDNNPSGMHVDEPE
jgi:hypothetical protein